MWRGGTLFLTIIQALNWYRIIAGIWRRFVFFAEAAKHDSRDPNINLQLYRKDTEHLYHAFVYSLIILLSIIKHTHTRTHQRGQRVREREYREKRTIKALATH